MRLVFGQGGNRERGKELRSAGGQDGTNLEASLAAAANDFQHFIGGDAARNDQQQFLAAQIKGMQIRGGHVPEPDSTVSSRIYCEFYSETRGWAGNTDPIFYPGNIYMLFLSG